MMTLSLRAMRYVQAALRQGSISAAAGEMNVAPSAIASALTQAEATFGVALATRARAKGIFPTTAGREVQRRIDDLLERYDGLLADVSDLQTGISGSLAIGYNAPIAPAFLPPIISQLLAVHPDVDLSFTEGDNTSVTAGLIEGQFDVIIFVEEVPNVQIATRPLVFAPTYCLCPQDHPLARKATVHVSDILQEPLILLDRPAARSYYMELLAQGDSPVQLVGRANSTEMVRSLVAEGLGVSLLNMRPRDVTTYAGGQVCCLPLAGVTNGVQLSLGFAPGPMRRLTHLFVDACTAYFDGPEGGEFVVTSGS